MTGTVKNWMLGCALLALLCVATSRITASRSCTTRMRAPTSSSTARTNLVQKQRVLCRPYYQSTKCFRSRVCRATRLGAFYYHSLFRWLWLCRSSFERQHSLRQLRQYGHRGHGAWTRWCWRRRIYHPLEPTSLVGYPIPQSLQQAYPLYPDTKDVIYGDVDIVRDLNQLVTLSSIATVAPPGATFTLIPTAKSASTLPTHIHPINRFGCPTLMCVVYWVGPKRSLSKRSARLLSTHEDSYLFYFSSVCHTLKH